MTVYIAASGGRIKVGFTSRPVDKRLASISSYLPKPMVLIGSLDGGLALEAAILRDLKPWSTGGEWVRDCPEVRARIQEFLAGPEAAGLVIEPPKPRPAFVPSEENEQPRIPIMSMMMWGETAVAELVALSKQPESVVLQWMDGSAEVPRLVRLAFATVALMWMFGKPQSFIGENTDE